MYTVKFKSNLDTDDNIGIPYATEQEAENAIQTELRFYMAYLDEQHMKYDYAVFGNKTELWTPGNDVYAEWERTWQKCYCASCGQECHADTYPEIVFTDAGTGTYICEECSIDYEKTEDGIKLRENIA